jgi:hypothetical protein
MPPGAATAGEADGDSDAGVGAEAADSFGPDAVAKGAACAGALSVATSGAEGAISAALAITSGAIGAAGGGRVGSVAGGGVAAGGGVGAGMVAAPEADAAGAGTAATEGAVVVAGDVAAAAGGALAAAMAGGATAGVVAGAAAGLLAAPVGAAGDDLVALRLDVQATTVRSSSNAMTATIQVFRFIPAPCLVSGFGERTPHSSGRPAPRTTAAATS